MVNSETKLVEVDIAAPGVARLFMIMVNVYFIKSHEGNGSEWILVDAGIGNCAEKIKNAAYEFLGERKKPSAIILTHGHFDHIGALKNLAIEWDVPVYAHKKELPYLTGKSSYPPPDPTVGGGAMSLLSWAYPKGPIDLGNKVQPFPSDGKLPGMPEWQIIDTPGHSPGHVSFFRESDRTLIAGDAIVTVKQESALAVLNQKQELHGPPAYFTCDWPAAKQSVKKILNLKPQVAATGHGIPMKGEELQNELKNLYDNFEKLAKPHSGRYVYEPAFTNDQGVIFIPPAQIGFNAVIGLLAVGALVGFSLFSLFRKK